MASLDAKAGRHAVVDRRPGRYLSFPDVCQAADGSLVAVYREADQHVAGPRRLLLSRSQDQGRSWSPPEVLDPDHGHCPRCTRLADGRLLMIDDDLPYRLFRSDALGHSFVPAMGGGLVHGLADRVVALPSGEWLTTAHLHRGEHPHPKTRQATTEQMVYVSADQGASWRMRAVMAYDPCLVLCEASMTALPDGRLIALLRENSGVYEPMYLVTSQDQGRTWSRPRPTPLLGHRPTLGQTASGHLLVTYRNVAPDRGTAAWLGSLEELERPYAVHGLAPGATSLRISSEALEVHTRGGPDSCLRYCLRPLTDPERARAELRLEVEVCAAEPEAVAVYLGGLWWRFTPGALRVEGLAPLRLPPGRLDVRLRYLPGEVRLAINGRRRAVVAVDPMQAASRPILLGNARLDTANAGQWRLFSAHLAIAEPAYDREYQWRWQAKEGLPDAWARRHVLELASARQAWGPDFGYSGWVEHTPGEFVCVYHQALGDAPDYVAGETSWVAASRFQLSDFPAMAE